MLVGPASQLVGTGAQLIEALVAFERAQEILDEPVEDASGKRTVELRQLEGSILFENVIFSYGDGPPVLQGLSFSAAPGSITALVGASGAGKSTIMHLIAAFYRCSSGRILVDGVNLDEATLSSYRRQVGIVSQQTFLFHGSVRENIAFARPAATLSEIREVCRLANVDEFVRHLPEGLETEIGERGVRLSGGQCQRIAIARALLANPRILVLDEATSNLDSESEAVVQDGLARSMAGRTTFVCAHRLSTVRTADQILVIENGQIVERGCHDSLYAKRGRYWELHGDHLPAADAAHAG
jgi:ABC-type multidrug transport system fused ATPase/permease subunit